MYKIGDQIVSTNLSTYKLYQSDNAKIKAVHKNNGFYDYDIEYVDTKYNRTIKINLLEKEITKAGN